MSRTIKLLITFDGTAYSGWQRQPKDMTVQGVLENRLKRMCQEEILLHGAGRTDAGVHALGMVAHFNTLTTFPAEAFIKGLNSMLPKDIRILQATTAEEGFHSRFSAQYKTYRYDFFTGPIQNPGTRLYAAHYPGNFYPEPVKAALKLLIGTHDFSSFERAGSRDLSKKNGRGAVRTLFHADLVTTQAEKEFWSLRFSGDGFLRQMVRNLAGTIMEVGNKRIEPEAILEILKAKNRSAAGATAPACGLWLEKVAYSSPELIESDND